MPRRVVITEDAQRDLALLYDYIADHDSVVQAERIMDRLLDTADSLAQNADRGSHPRELVAFGFREFRQIALKPWRIIYGVEADRVVVYVIADGRRDMRTLLAQRLLGA
ncbi:MAG TPA: type II toxin-antitoxin system RelE/ParE family toxin [Rhodanobacteraceae bacterium]|nr:type II toxin-antitoxin system RelE/ParE family toxin [Rhodanobacteraceae bacterium]